MELDTINRNEKKPKKDMNKIECFACGEMGHYANKCPQRQSDDEQDDKQKHGHVTWHADIFCTYQVTAIQQGRFKASEVLLDNQADISIV